MTKEFPRGTAWQKRLAERGVKRPMIDLLIRCCDDEREERPADGACAAQQLAKLLDGMRGDGVGPVGLPPEPPKRFPDSPNSVGMGFKQISAGTFLMGSPDTEMGRQVYEGPRHSVTISRAFYLGIHPVTQRQY